MIRVDAHVRSRVCAWLPLLTIAGLVPAVSGCGANMTAALATASQAWDGGRSKAETTTSLNPAFEYLRVETGRQTGLMVRAGDEPSAHGRVEPWYSADGAVLRLAQGRVVSFTESTRSWQLTQALESVDWRQVAAGQPQSQTWVVDEQPGYRMGRRFDRVIELSLSGPPGISLSQPNRGVRWFRERDLLGASQPAWYAVDLKQQPARVIYAQTCLNPQWCLNWRPWPPKETP